MLLGILHFFADADEPRGLTGQLTAPLAPGSCLALTHLASDLHSDALSETFDRLNSAMAESVTLRSRGEVAALLGGLDLVEPRVVQATQWAARPRDGRARVADVVRSGVQGQLSRMPPDLRDAGRRSRGSAL